MTNQEFISSLKEVEDTSKHNEFVSGLIQNEPNRLIEIFSLIPKDQDYLLYNWQFRSIYERIIKASSFEIDLNRVNVTNEIFNCCFREQDKNLMASVLTYKFPSLELINEQIKINNNELTELLIQELVSRGVDLSDSENFEKIKEINSNGKFSKLSLESSKLESENVFPTYAQNGGGNGITFGFQRNEEFKPIETMVSSQTILKDSKSIKCAIEHWGGISFGYRGKYTNELSIENIIVSIPELVDSKRIRSRKLNPSRAFSLIFNASSNGSAYSTGYYGANGRLRTWNTINSMVSDNDFKSIQDTEKRVNEYNWYEFNTDSWFINEWLDLGLIGINFEKKEFGIIAATDTD